MKGISTTTNNNLPLKKSVFEAGRSQAHYWQDIWRYRELFYFLAWRDILVRYKQTIMGVAWAVLRPLTTMIVFTIIFERFARFPSEGETPYAIMVFAALLPWQFFSNSLIQITVSLVGNAGLISKIYFPRLIIPTSTIIVGLVDFMISFTILGLMMVWYQFYPDWRILTLPLFLLLVVTTTLGLGVWFSALNVKYRDLHNMVPVLVQLGLYFSPIGFSSTIVPDKWRPLYSLNPMVGVIDGFRWALNGGESQPYWPGIIFSAFMSMLILWFGLKYFRKVERTFADLI